MTSYHWRHTLCPVQQLVLHQYVYVCWRCTRYRHLRQGLLHVSIYLGIQWIVVIFGGLMMGWAPVEDGNSIVVILWIYFFQVLMLTLLLWGMYVLSLFMDLFHGFVIVTVFQLCSVLLAGLLIEWLPMLEGLLLWLPFVHTLYAWHDPIALTPMVLELNYHIVGFHLIDSLSFLLIGLLIIVFIGNRRFNQMDLI